MTGPEQVKGAAGGKEQEAAAGMKGLYSTHAQAAHPQPQGHSTEVLHQRASLSRCPMKMAVGGFAIAATLGYFVLYSKKKPEASAIDVARVASGISDPENTHPRK